MVEPGGKDRGSDCEISPKAEFSVNTRKLIRKDNTVSRQENVND